MFFPFTNYKTVAVNNPSDGTVLYTTTAKSVVYFEPDGTGMESDQPVGIYVNNYYSDVDGNDFLPFIFYAYDDIISGTQDKTPHTRVINSDDIRQGFLTSMIVPSGKDIRSYRVDSSDQVSGTLHIMELPAAV